MTDQEEGIPAPNPPPGQAQEVQAQQAPQGWQFVHLNWSNFKLEFSGRPDEDVEAHLLHANDWMNAHHFIEGVKVQRFCLTLLGLSMNTVLGEVILGETLEIMIDKTVEENIETAIEMTVMIEAGTDLERGYFPEIMAIIEPRSTSKSKSRSGSRASTNMDRIHCYQCRGYDHFAKDCLTSKEEREIKQLQQMLNLGDEQLVTPPT